MKLSRLRVAVVLSLAVLVGVPSALPSVPLGTEGASEQDPVSPLDALATARSIVTDRLDHLVAGSDAVLVQGVQQQLRNLDTTGRLLEIHAAEHASEVHRAVALAQQATRHQATSLGADWVEPVTLAGHVSPSSALLEIAARHGVTPTHEELEAIMGLDETLEPLRGALTRFLDAFLALDAAARNAYQNVDPALLKELEDQRDPLQAFEAPASQLALLQAAGLDPGLVFPTRNQFLDAVRGLHDALQETRVAAGVISGPVDILGTPEHQFFAGVATSFPRISAILNGELPEVTEWANLDEIEKWELVNSPTCSEIGV